MAYRSHRGALVNNKLVDRVARHIAFEAVQERIKQGYPAPSDEEFEDAVNELRKSPAVLSGAREYFDSL